MCKRTTVLFLLFASIIPSSVGQNQSNLQLYQNSKKMNSIISIFEIPAIDIARAVKFYKSILGIEINELEFPGMHMGLFPAENQASIGVIIKGEDQVPSENGITIYLNAGHDLQIVLNRIEHSGGKIKTPKTPHADESGFFAIFIDSEGNRLGLHSTN